MEWLAIAMILEYQRFGEKAGNRLPKIRSASRWTNLDSLASYFTWKHITGLFSTLGDQGICLVWYSKDALLYGVYWCQYGMIFWHFILALYFISYECAILKYWKLSTVWQTNIAGLWLGCVELFHNYNFLWMEEYYSTLIKNIHIFLAN